MRTKYIVFLLLLMLNFDSAFKQFDSGAILRNKLCYRSEIPLYKTLSKQPILENNNLINFVLTIQFKQQRKLSEIQRTIPLFKTNVQHLFPQK